MLSLKFIAVFLMPALLSAPSFARAREKPLALIYKGAGSCSAEEGDAGEHEAGCSEAAAVVAMKAGFRVRFVGPKDLAEEATEAQVTAFFKTAKVWIQPGGVAATALFSMTTPLQEGLVKFVHSGGGYVGWCAGAFMATASLGETRYAGLGIFPGGTGIYRTYTESGAVDYSLQEITWKGKKRSIYYEGGPFLYGLENEPTASIVGLYDTGYVAAARATYGSGRVFISGPHPEAPAVWTKEDGINDPDGPDLDLAIEMVRWAAKVLP